MCIIEACEDRDLSGAVRKRALVVTVLLAGLWATLADAPSQGVSGRPRESVGQ